jgi:hypothetical protein
VTIVAGSLPPIAQRRAYDLGRSLISTYDLWLASWETALAAISIATRSGTFSTHEAAARNAVIKAERELVMTHFTGLLGYGLPRRGAR